MKIASYTPAVQLGRVMTEIGYSKFLSHDALCKAASMHTPAYQVSLPCFIRPPSTNQNDSCKITMKWQYNYKPLNHSYYTLGCFPLINPLFKATYKHNLQVAAVK